MLQAEAYIEYLKNFNYVQKPKMPNFNVFAYTENEYLNAIYSINKDFECINDVELTLKYLKGE